MAPLGLIECFYGKLWAVDDRLRFISFLKQIGFDFYLYGPKGDPALRQEWYRRLTNDETQHYQNLRRHAQAEKMRFGFLLSPSGLFENFSSSRLLHLNEKVQALSAFEPEFLGLFFDDMKASPEMAERQLEILEAVRKQTSAQLLFCPSYYSDDTLLDMLFGERPANYIEMIGRHVPTNVEILWTGEEIISRSISAAHLQAVAERLKRKPFLCDNYFADDGPINCQFLKLQPLDGREAKAFACVSHWAFNPMNQLQLSKVVLQAAAKVVRTGVASDMAFAQALQSLVPPGTAAWIIKHAGTAASHGLEGIAPLDRQVLHGLPSDPYQREILDWLNGVYAVDLGDMLSQSGLRD